jgi:hypothetical protein
MALNDSSALLVVHTPGSQENTYLNDNTKTPRSLQLNCGIVTSPALQNHPDFIQIQEDFQNDLLTFIKKGAAHMAEWQRIYIHILTIERCSTLLKKALPILEGLISFFTETLEAPKWPSIPTKRINLLMLKLYLTTDSFDTSNLLSHLEMPHDQVLLTASKLITGQDSDEEALAEINCLNLSDLDFTNPTEHEFLSETPSSVKKKKTETDQWSAKGTPASFSPKNKVSAMERNGGSETLPSKPTSHQSWEPTRATKTLYHIGLPFTAAAAIPASAPSSFFLLPSTCPSHFKPILSSPKSNDWIRHEPIPPDAYAIPIFPSAYATPTTNPSNHTHRSTATTNNYSEPFRVHEPEPECCNEQK